MLIGNPCNCDMVKGAKFCLCFCLRAISFSLFKLSQVFLLIYVGLKTSRFILISGIIIFLNTSSTMGFPLYPIFCRYFWTFISSGYLSAITCKSNTQNKEKIHKTRLLHKSRNSLSSRILVLFFNF